MPEQSSARLHDEVRAAARLAIASGAETTPFSALSAKIQDRTAIVAVVGLGYVGLPVLLAAAEAGFGVVGMDADPSKVLSLRQSRSYIVDVADEELAAVEDLVVTSDRRELERADVIVISVPTPLLHGAPDLSFVRSASADVAASIAPGQLIVLESTTYPGTTEDLVRPILETSGLVAGRDFALAYSPERIDPGSARTLRATPKVVAGIGPEDTAVAVRFYSTLVDRVVPTNSPREAEMAKLIENTFRQVNIALVNELAMIAPAMGVDIWAALDAAATKPFGYMPFWPGPGVGGHCIAIDPSYLSWKVEQHLGYGIGFVEHARSVNNRMPEYVTTRISKALNAAGLATRGARILVLGLTYKAGVSDVRESPALAVLERLVAAGADCSYHDPYASSVEVSPADVSDLPRIGRAAETVVLESMPLEQALEASPDCVVILTAHASIDYDAVVANAALVFDAVGATRAGRSDNVVLL